jgi:two-component system, NtrC family, response regulator AtoC
VIDAVVADHRARREIGGDGHASTILDAVSQETTVTTATPTGGDQLFLLVVGDRVHATEALPGKGAVVIGRAPECDVRIDDNSISRNHAVLHVDAPLRVIDTQSANGVWINDQRVGANEPIEIQIDQAVRLGSVTIIVQRRRVRSPQPRRIRTHEYFESRLEDECDRAERTGRSFTVIHVVGDDDAELREVLADALSDDDVIAAYAPGELELLFAGADAERGRAVARALETALDARGLAVRLGTAWYPRDGRDPSSLASRARGRAHGQVIAVEAGDVVVADDRMRALHQLVAQVAAADIGVLLQGETGVGKEVFAEAIHRQSARSAKPFLKLNCAALSETLLESELFGHERGAFTGAVATKPGLLEVADGGVVFLDEVGELLPSIQAKLLRVLDDRRLTRVGGLEPRPIDVRIVAATNRDLDEEVRRGAFRLDLLYRLNAISIIIPALRERVDEIVPLAGRFLHGLAAKLGRPVPRLTGAAIALLRGYRWPGNVRELRNVIERAMVLANGDVIDVHELPEDRMRAAIEPPPAAPRRAATEPPLEAEERQRILDALETCAGNQTHAANLLGVSRRTLINKLDKFALPRPRKK